MKLKALPLTIFVTAQIVSHIAFGQVAGLPEGILLQDQVYGGNSEMMLVSPDFQKRMNSFVKAVLASPLKMNQSAQIGWMNIEQLISEVDEVKVYANTSNKAVVGSQNRLGSVNFTEQRIALINTSLLKELTRPQGEFSSLASAAGSEALIIHEFLGALGYPDDNYEISTLLYMRSFPQDYGQTVLKLTEKSLTAHLGKFSRRTQNATSFSGDGTSTGIGSGGDPASAAMKLVALATLAQQKSLLLQNYVKNEEEYENLIQFINTVRIEPTDRQVYNSTSTPPAESIVTVKDGRYLVVNTAILAQIKTSQMVTAMGFTVVHEALKLMRASR